MKVIIHNHCHGRGRPKGSTKEAVRVRNGYIVRAYYDGFRKQVIADMFGVSYALVCRIIKEAKNDNISWIK